MNLSKVNFAAPVYDVAKCKDAVCKLLTKLTNKVNDSFDEEGEYVENWPESDVEALERIAKEWEGEVKDSGDGLITDEYLADVEPFVPEDWEVETDGAQIYVTKSVDDEVSGIEEAHRVAGELTSNMHPDLKVTAIDCSDGQAWIVVELVEGDEIPDSLKISDATHEERYENAKARYGSKIEGYLSELSRCKGDKRVERTKVWKDLAEADGNKDLVIALQGFEDGLANFTKSAKGIADFTPVHGSYMYVSDKFFSDLTNRGFNVSRKSASVGDFDTSMMSRNGNAWLIAYEYTLTKDGKTHSYMVGNMTKESGGSYGWMLPYDSNKGSWSALKPILTMGINKDFNIQL